MTTDTTIRPGIAARLDTFTDSDGNPGYLIELVEAGAVVATLTPARARGLARELTHLADTTEPLNREAFTSILRGLGDALGTELTLEAVAAEIGVDVETATEADSFRIARARGERMVGPEVSIGPGARS
jgi:hypothetical protein